MQSPPANVLITGVDHNELKDFLGEVMQRQGNSYDADWVLQGEAAQLVEHGDAFRLRPPHDGSLWGRARRMTFEDFTDVEMSLPLEADSLAEVERLCIVLDPQPNALNEDEDINRLNDIHNQIRSSDSRRLSSILLVINDSLTRLNTLPPPLDALDKWEQLCDGLEPGEPPMRIASNRENWNDAFKKMDKDWSYLLSSLNKLSYKQKLQFATIPISLNGFLSATGLVQTDPAKRYLSSAFNISVLTKALQIPEISQIGNCLSPPGRFG